MFGFRCENKMSSWTTNWACNKGWQKFIIIASNVIFNFVSFLEKEVIESSFLAEKRFLVGTVIKNNVVSGEVWCLPCSNCGWVIGRIHLVAQFYLFHDKKIINSFKEYDTFVSLYAMTSCNYIFAHSCKLKNNHH